MSDDHPLLDRISVLKRRIERLELTKCERCISGMVHKKMPRCTINIHVRLCEYPHHFKEDRMSKESLEVLNSELQERVANR